MSHKYIVAGGDMRFAALAEQLAETETVYALGFDRNIFTSPGCKSLHILPKNTISVPERADYLILPLPASQDGTTLNTPLFSGAVSLESLTSSVKEDGIVFGGKLTPKIKEIFTSRGLTVIDYLEREEFAVMNAVATAEGALLIALEEQPTILSGHNILILGMGRIAKSLIRILSGFGTDLTAAARKYSDLAWAEIFGCNAIHLSELKNSSALSDADIIFNTVPSMILNKDLLRKLKHNALVIDLASKPGGIDFDAAGQLGIRAIWALSLPGRTAPVSSGAAVGKTIRNILNERRSLGKEGKND
ncbi:MAG: dipicolinate synthase subunit DpsA [Huintestinicola sp.]